VLKQQYHLELAV